MAGAWISLIELTCQLCSRGRICASFLLRICYSQRLSLACPPIEDCTSAPSPGMETQCEELEWGWEYSGMEWDRLGSVSRTSLSLYQERLSAVRMNQYSRELPLMRETGMLSQPLRITWLPILPALRFSRLDLEALQRGGCGYNS